MRRSSYFPLACLIGLGSLACATEDDTPPTAAAADTSSEELSAVSAAPGRPLPGLSGPQRELFNQGLAVFATEFTPATGLGPLFNSTSCAACHDDPALGGYGDSAEVAMSSYHPGAASNVLGGAGGPVVQQHVTPALQAVLNILKEPNLPGANAKRSEPLESCSDLACSTR